MNLNHCIEITKSLGVPTEGFVVNTKSNVISFAVLNGFLEPLKEFCRERSEIDKYIVLDLMSLNYCARILIKILNISWFNNGEMEGYITVVIQCEELFTLSEGDR